MRPKARTEGLLIEEFGTEALIYDRDTDMMHRLDPRAYHVWRSCDGHTAIEMIARTMGEEQQGEHHAADHLAAAEAAVSQLKEAGLLLSGDEDEASAKPPPTRRNLLAKAGAAGAAAGGLVLVYSIAAPTPAMAASHPCGAVPGPVSGSCNWVCFSDGTWHCNGTGPNPCHIVVSGMICTDSPC